jgi:hypothetical protein
MRLRVLGLRRGHSGLMFVFLFSPALPVQALEEAPLDGRLVVLPARRFLLASAVPSAKEFARILTRDGAKRFSRRIGPIKQLQFCSSGALS